MLKRFDGKTDKSHRCSPPRVGSVEHVWIQGFHEASQVSPSHVEGHDWTSRTHLRRFVRLSNGFSHKLANLRAAFAMYACWFNWCKRHTALRMTPAMAAGLAGSFWTIDQLVP